MRVSIIDAKGRECFCEVNSQMEHNRLVPTTSPGSVQMSVPLMHLNPGYPRHSTFSKRSSHSKQGVRGQLSFTVVKIQVLV